MGRGFPGKAMFVAIDKATAVRMFDKCGHCSRLRRRAFGIGSPIWRARNATRPR
jgi:hypothetical protein